MRGELILTRPGECLPLIRYPTGDMIEVMDPAYKFTIKLETTSLDITLPAIMSLSRTTNSVDYDSGDQNGNFFGFKVYSRQINDALFKIQTSAVGNSTTILTAAPADSSSLFIPEAPVQNRRNIPSEIHASLTRNRVVSTSAAIRARQFKLDPIIKPTETRSA
jgi:hypothetical protein